MTKRTSFAKEDVMEAYLDGLLEGYDEPDKNRDETTRLLAKAELLDPPIIEPVDMPVAEPAIDAPESEIEAEEVVSTSNQMPTTVRLVEQLEETFQALFFEVAGLTLAVPLITLGGIHRLNKVGPLFGKPDWFKGVMLHRDEKLNVVDTAKWVMPEKITPELEESLKYEYLIMLADSPWGLASDKLVNTITLNKADVKWRHEDSKRPWLAGMVKERMCALIDVYQLISMLNRGLGRDA